MYRLNNLARASKSHPIISNELLQYTKSFKSIKSKPNHLTHKRIMSTESMTSEESKSNAAQAAVRENITADCVMGIGSGSTMVYVVEHLKNLCRELNLNVKCIPTSLQAKQLIIDNGLNLADLCQYPTIDITIDGADEVDRNLVAIKGGGACLAQEKIVASASKYMCVVADGSKKSLNLGDAWKRGIPIEVLPMACESVRTIIAHSFNVPMKDIVIRVGRAKAGPVMTDNGNMILDWLYEFENSHHFDSKDWTALSNKIKVIPGVVETGIFSEMINKAYFGYPGRVVTLPN